MTDRYSMFHSRLKAEVSYEKTRALEVKERVYGIWRTELKERKSRFRPSPGCYGGGAGKGRIACNNVSGI